MSNLSQTASGQPAVKYNQPDQEHTETPTHRDGRAGRWGGFVLVLIGAIFMLQNAGILRPLVNWWALFLLFPAVAALAAGLAIYRRQGSWAAASGSFIGGLMILFIAIAFLSGINLSLFWPFFLIAAGFAVLLVSALARSR